MKRPHELIADMVRDRQSWSDRQVLGELESLQPLADESDPCWRDPEYWAESAYLFVALGDIAAARKLRSAVPLLLERACYGDPGEMMRGLRHVSEAIFEPDWDSLTSVCVMTLQSTRAGTRMWAASQLGVLRDPSSIAALKALSDDPMDQVRREVALALKMIEAADGH